MHRNSPLAVYQPRLLMKPELDRFIWYTYNFTTEYVELYTLIMSGVNQPVLPKIEHQPTRLFSLSFETLVNTECVPAAKEPMSFKSLEAFYLKHGMFGRFILPHPVYGELMVRFNKPLSVPKSRANGNGTVESFTLEMVEVLSQPYVFHPLEKQLNFGPSFPLKYYNVEVEYPIDASVIALGGSHQMVFKDGQKRLRIFKLSFPIMQYIKSCSGLSFADHHGVNCLLLEAFYIKHRLFEPFILDYSGEKIPVVFKNPLKIPQVTGNTGCISGLEIELMENPYPDFSGVLPPPVDPPP